MRVASGPDPPGSSRCVFERRKTSVSRVYLSVTLATPAPSGSTDTPWLCRGRLPPIPAPPETGCPQLHRPAATGRRRRSLTSTQSTSASRRTGGVTQVEDHASRQKPREPSRPPRGGCGRRNSAGFGSLRPGSWVPGTRTRVHGCQGGVLERCLLARVLHGAPHDGVATRRQAGTDYCGGGGGGGGGGVSLFPAP